MPPKGSKGSSSRSFSEVNRFPSSSARYAKKVYDENVAGKRILEEKSFDLGFLHKYIPNYLETLRAWGWTEFLKSKSYIMPEIIKHVYFFGQDKTYDDKGGVVGTWETPKLPTRLFNSDVIITDTLVNEVAGITVTEGLSIIPRLNVVERMNFRKIVFKKEHWDVFPSELALISNLDVPERILHYIIGKRFFPRSRPSEFTDLDLVCMVRIMKGEPLNFGALVVDKMQEACVRARGEKPFHCPYGKLITLICERLFGGSKLSGMEKVEDDGDDGLRDNINLMSFEYRGNNRCSPGYESLDDQFAKVQRGELGPERRRGVKKHVDKLGQLESTYYTAKRGIRRPVKRNRMEGEEEMEEEEEEERGHRENVGDVSFETLMNTMVQGFARLESNQAEIRATMSEIQSNQGVMMTTIDGMDVRMRRMEEKIHVVDENLTDIEEGRFGGNGAGSSGGGNDTMDP